MNVSEVAQIITMIAAYDPYQRRAADPQQAQQDLVTQARAWHMALTHSAPDLTAEAAAGAVVKFHSENAGRPMSVADLISMGTEIQRRAEAARLAEERRQRHALPAGARPEPVGVRDRSADVAALLSELMDRYRNWDVVGDPKVRASQATRAPGLAARREKARHARAQQIARERTAERARRVAAGLDPIGTDWPSGSPNGANGVD